jgi:flagellar motor switch protein FliG
MKKCLLILAITLVWLNPLLFAQDKIYSLSLKEHETEEAIRSALSPHLEKKDFVVKVRLTGVKKVDAIPAPVQQLTEQTGEALPGFEFESEVAATRITEVVGSQYWEISKMRIDLVMYKAISRSVDTYIRETVPVVSEFNPARGDIFNFVPILPKSLGAAAEEAADTPYFEQERDYYGLSKNEWIYLSIAALFGILALILIWRLTRLRRNITVLEDAIEEGQAFERGLDPEKAQKQKLEQQESIIKQSILTEKNDKLIQDIITKLLGRTDWAVQLYQEFGKDKRGVDKLARFFSTLGPLTSRKLFYTVMGEDKYLEVERMAEGVKKAAEQDNDTLQEIQKILFAKTLTSPERTTFDPFSFLKELSTGQVAFLIKDEPVKIKAIVLCQLKSSASAEILARISKEERGKVIQQLGKMNDLPLELAEKVAYNLADKAKNVPGDSTVGFDGVDMVVEVISESDAGIRTDMINNLRVSDRVLSEKVESRLFLFESIPVVPNEILVDVVRRLSPDDVITALVGCSKQLQEKVIMCFPEKNRRTLVSSLKAQTPTVETVREKQKLVVRAMQRLARDNRVDLRKIQAAWVKATAQKPQAKSA